MQSRDRIIRVGIAGLGRSGWRIHALTLEKMPDRYRVVAGCDPDPQRRDELTERYGCPAYADYAGLVRDPNVDLVVNALPSHLHAEGSIAALRAGKAVVVEKPMARNLEEADAMIAAARETGALLTVHQNARYMPDFVKLREVLASGKLGRIIQVRIAWNNFRRLWDWQSLREFGGGQLNNLASHIVDQALLLLPDDVEPSVFCQLERTPLWAGDADSHMRIILTVPGGPTIDLEGTDACAYPQDNYLVMGTQGGLTGTAKQLRWKYFNPDQVPPLEVNRGAAPGRLYNKETLPWIEETADLTGATIEHDTGFYADLYPSLIQGHTPPVSVESIRRQIIILDACRQANPWTLEPIQPAGTG